MMPSKDVSAPLTLMNSPFSTMIRKPIWDAYTHGNHHERRLANVPRGDVQRTLNLGSPSPNLGSEMSLVVDRGLGRHHVSTRNNSRSAAKADEMEGLGEIPRTWIVGGQEF